MVINFGLATNLRKDSHFMEFLNTMKDETMGVIFQKYSEAYPDKAKALVDKPVEPLAIKPPVEEPAAKVKPIFVEPAPVGLKFVAEDYIQATSEDSGCALIAEPISFNTLNSDDDNGMCVRITSWDDDTVHSDMRPLVGKKVRVTIEILE